MSGGLTNTRRWEPVVAPVQSAPGHRAPELLRAVVAQFDPVGNPRYQKDEHGATFCNILSWDVTSALGAEIPHWVQDHGSQSGRHELNVNATLDWLDHVGHEAGWDEVDERTAAARASLGHPVVAVWRNPKPGHHGHIAILLPPRAGAIHIAQAGSHNFYDVPIRDGFGAVQPIRFFAHH